MERKTRSNKLMVVDWPKREMAKDNVTHYILFPAIFSTIGKTNDFFSHALSLCLIKKNLKKDLRCQHLFRGLCLGETVNFSDLEKSLVSGRFTSCRSNDLGKIGKIAGYFVRQFACSVGKSLDDEWIPEFYPPIADEGFDEFIRGLKENKIIVPAVAKLDISSNSCFDETRFVRLTENEVDRLFLEEEHTLTRHHKLFRITTNLYDWAWQLLNTIEYQDRHELLSKGIPVMDHFKLQENPSNVSEHRELHHQKRCNEDEQYQPSYSAQTVNLPNAQIITTINANQSSHIESSADFGVPDVQGTSGIASSKEIEKFDSRPKTKANENEARPIRKKKRTKEVSVVKVEMQRMDVELDKDKIKRGEEQKVKELQKKWRKKLDLLEFSWIKFSEKAKYIPGFLQPKDPDGISRAQHVTTKGVLSDYKYEYFSQDKNIPEMLKPTAYIEALEEFNQLLGYENKNKYF